MSPLAIVCCLVLPVLAQDDAAKSQADPRLQAAGAQAQKAADATLAGDWETLINLTHPKIVELAGGRAKMLELLETQMGQMKKDGIVLKESAAGTPTQIAEAESTLYSVVPTRNVIEVPQGTLISNSYLIGASSDGGEHWTFIDSSPGSERIRQIFPELPDSLELPEKEQPAFQPKDSGN